MKKTRACWTCQYRSPIPTYSGDRFACRKYGCNVKPNQRCAKGDEVFEFNFPPYRNVPKSDWESHAEQVRYTIGELEEALAAIEKRDERNFVEELMDAHHSNETSLRGFAQETLDDAARKVVEKNAERGYYRK